MSIQNYFDYFKQISQNYKKINHFYLVDFLEFDSFFNELKGSTNKPGDITLLIEHYSRTKIANYYDNQHDSLRCAFSVLCRINLKQKTQTDKLTALALTESITYEIESKLIIDYQKQVKILDGLEIESFKTEKASLEGEFVGQRTTFTLNQSRQPQLTTADWNYHPFTK